MNIYDVSQKAGVSIATVSRVLNGNPNVSQKTKEKVLEVMNELGYKPNVFARGLGLNTMKAIGIMCPDSSDTFLANAVYYLEQNLRKYGYEIILSCTGYELENKRKNLEMLLSKRVDAIILVGSSFLESTRKENMYIIDAADSVPVVIINGYLSHPNVFCSLCDDRQAIYDVTTRFVDSGRKDIIYLYHSKSYSGLQKMSGYKDAVIDNGSPLNEKLIIQCENNITSAKEALFNAYKNGISFDAVVAAEDVLAVGALKFAKELNLSVPDKLSIVGYNNSILANCCEPELTSIDNHIEALCVTAISTLMRVFEGSSVPNKTTISNDLIIRKTTDFGY